MRYIKYILIVILSASTFVGCETVDFGDINENTNGPSEPFPAGLMSGAMMSFATITGRTGLMQPTLYVQYQSQVTYIDEMLYSVVPVSWYTYYVTSLNALDEVIKFNQDESNFSPTLLSQGSPENQIGVAKIFEAVVMKRVTDNWGDAPYSMAFQGTEGLTPVYDTQEEIYNALIAQVKEGRDMLDPGGNPPTGDIIYGGDVMMWKKFANSFLLQLTIQLSEVYPDASGFAATEFNAALNDPNGVIEELSEEAYFQFEDQVGFRNPWNSNRTPDYFMSQEFSDALKGNMGLNPTSNHTYDERIQVYSTDPSKDGVPYGYEDGIGDGASSISNDYYWNNTSSLPLLTASYTFLNRADAANIGWTGESVTDMLRAGIEMSFATLEAKTVAESEDGGELIAEDGPAYATVRIADAATVPGGFSQIIAEEKWVSLFGQGFVAWAEWRRTGYPVLQPATDYFNNGEIPTRYLYPIEEAALNKENYQAGVAHLSTGADEGTAHVWWDQ